jgi:hypothetical protein|tara:strand:- start:861 stop:1160 length:300 start_codon:yes stop_codon:yes gene_type:complete
MITSVSPSEQEVCAEMLNDENRKKDKAQRADKYFIVNIFRLQYRFQHAKYNFINGICIFAKKNTMSNHEEPQQDEVGGPVTIALFIFAIVIISIYFIAS